MSRNLGMFDYICSNADKLALLLAMEGLAGVLSVGLYLALPPGSPGRVVSALNVFGVVVIGGFTAALLLACYRR